MLIAAVPAVAHAADDALPKAALLDVRATQGATAAQAAQLRSQLAAGLRKYRIELVEQHPAVVAAHGAGADAALAPALNQARTRAREGKKLLDDLDPQGAEVKLRQAADLFEANAGGLSSPADLIGTYLQLARVFFATEREMLARDIFKRVVQLQPDLALDKAVYPPDMVKIFDDVKKSVLASPLGSMSVSSVPAPARVYLDGRDRGVTPVDLVNIPAGVHTVTVRRVGYAPWVRPVDITSFRVDKLIAELALDRHPSLEGAFVAGGATAKDTLGTTLVEYLGAVAVAAELQMIVIGRALRKDKSTVLEVVAYRPEGRLFGKPISVAFVSAPKQAELDELAARVLRQAVDDKWLPALSARRTVSAGGGALDESARIGVRAAFTPAARLGGKRTNFPNAPAVGFRVGADYRLGPRLLLSADTGYDAMVQENLVLTDSSGNVVASSGARVQSIWTSIPVDVGARYYFGVSTLAPYAAGSVGIRWDELRFREPLPFDEIRGSSGLGFGMSLGGGADYAIGSRSAIFAEGRLHLGTVGVKRATVDITTTPQDPDRRLPVDAGFFTGFRASIGYLRVF